MLATSNAGTVTAATDVPSIISSDTKWTKANSPYELKGPTLVSDDVTLTIEPGTTVNLNDFYIQVNGTLVARGSSTDQIHFNGGIIKFTESSTDWNEQTSSGCIIENANLENTRLEIGNSPKLHKNSIYEISVDGSPIISENTIYGEVSIRGSPNIVGNSIINSTSFSLSIGGGSPTISHNTINCRIWVSHGYPTISDNTIFDGVHVDSRGATVTISNNTITGLDSRLIFVTGVPAVISNNTLIGTGTKDVGIHIVNYYGFSISGNTISNCSVAIIGGNSVPLTIENNWISNSEDGIRLTQTWTPSAEYFLIIRNNFITDNSGVGVSLNHPFATIMNNSITNNDVGITIGDFSGESPASPTIVYNDIHSNQINIKSEVSDDLNATYNWWGTTDTQAINQTIYDIKHDFNVGTVNYVPFLTESNPEIPEFPPWAFFPLVLIITLFSTVIKRKISKSNLSRDCVR